MRTDAVPIRSAPGQREGELAYFARLRLGSRPVCYQDLSAVGQTESAARASETCPLGISDRTRVRVQRLGCWAVIANLASTSPLSLH